MIVPLTDAERAALIDVMGMRYDNVVETRQQTGNEEYDETDEDQCSVLLFMLSDWDYDADTLASTAHLFDAIWIALDTPEAFLGLDLQALRSAADKIGYNDDPEGG